MSIINTMLQDLERRGVECANSDDNILGGLSANHNSADADADDQAGRPYLVSLLSVISILVVIMSVYYLSPYQLVTVAQDKSEAQLASVGSLNIETQKPATYTKSVVVAQSETPVVTAVIVQSDKQSKIIQQAAIEQTSGHQENQKKTPVIAKEKTTRAKKQQRTARVEAQESVKPGRSSGVSQVVNKKQRAYTAQEKSQQAYAAALSLYNQGSSQQAKLSLKEALGFGAHNRKAYRLLSAIYLEEGRADLASEIIEQGLAVHANDQELLRLHLQALVQDANYPEAIVVMEQRLRLTSPEDLGYLAGLYQKNKDHLNAVKFYAQALQLKPSKSIWWIGQGISFEVMENYDEAVQAFQQSISTGQLSSKIAQYAISRINTIKQLNADPVS